VVFDCILVCKCADFLKPVLNPVLFFSQGKSKSVWLQHEERVPGSPFNSETLHLLWLSRPGQTSVNRPHEGWWLLLSWHQALIWPKLLSLGGSGNIWRPLYCHGMQGWWQGPLQPP
jgi:hypothetical protein